MDFTGLSYALKSHKVFWCLRVCRYSSLYKRSSMADTLLPMRQVNEFSLRNRLFPCTFTRGTSTTIRTTEKGGSRRERHRVGSNAAS
jgi:hypothetical protein